MTIIKINGAVQAPCKCGNWLQHWRNFSVLPLPSRCSETLCRDKPEVGAWVQRGDASGAEWYVVPLCKRHSQSTSALEISSFAMLVSANVKETCARD
jgi:hypothetical protein